MNAGMKGALKSVGEAANRPPGYTPWAPHHFWWGIGIASTGFILLFWLPHWASPYYWGIIGLGFWIAFDDVWQHHHQKVDPDYTSLWHDWYWSGLNWLIRRTKCKPGLNWFCRFLEWLKTV